MSDFEDDLSESEVSQTAPAKKQGMNLPKVSTPMLLGVGLLALLGSVGVWFALNPPAAPVPDPIVQTQPVTTPTTVTPTTPTTTAPTTTAAGTGVEAGNIPLIADKPKPATATAASGTKPTAKPAIKPAPKPVAPRVVNPFAPLPQSGSTSVAVVNSGNQGNPVIAVFNPQPQQPTIVRPTAAPQVIRTPIVSSPFAPRPTSSSGVAAAPAGTSTTVKPVPVVVAQQRPVIPKVLITKTPQAATTAAVQPRPPTTGLVAGSVFSITPKILAASPRIQAPIQATTPTNTNSNPTNTTNPTTPSVTPNTIAATQTPSTPSRPVVSEPPVFKIEPAPVSRPTTTPSTTTTPTTPSTVTTPTTPDPTITAPIIPVAPTAELIELRRLVQEDLRLEYAGFSIGTVKKAFFQSSRGLLSIAEGDPLIRDSSVILKSVSPTEVVLALGNELLTLPLVKR